MASKTVLDELKRTQILELLEQGKRIDGRALDEPREISIEINAIPKANGSAKLRLGETEVLCGVKIQPDKPFPDVGDKVCTCAPLNYYHFHIQLLKLDHHKLLLLNWQELLIEEFEKVIWLMFLI